VEDDATVVATVAIGGELPQEDPGGSMWKVVRRIL